ncbi:MAG: SMP-30/gluconolactonase/LRE family protein [Candidatus Promineifilaceae bacterium]
MWRKYLTVGVLVLALCSAAVVIGCSKTSSASGLDSGEAASSPDEAGREADVIVEAASEIAKLPEAAAETSSELARRSEEERVISDEQGGNPSSLSLVDTGVQVVYAFSAEDKELPEGLTIDKSGNIYAAGGTAFWYPDPEPYGAIWKISPDGDKMTVLYEYPEGPGPAGVAVSASGALYFAHPNPGNPDNGVFRLEDDGEAVMLPGSENIGLSNGLALNKQGDLYVSDSALGAIWRIPRESGNAEIWIQHILLGGCSEEFFVGANGIAFWKDAMYVANTSRGVLVRVPVLEDGTAGEPEIAVGDEECEYDDLWGMDGIALDVHGTVYALLVIQNQLVRINPEEGTHEVLLTGEDGLFNPASIAFGTGRGDRQHVFISNYALLEPGPEGNLGPSVLKYYVGQPGLPLP